MFATTIVWMSGTSAFTGTRYSAILALTMVGVAAAVANAVFHPTGVRVRDLPIRIEHLITA